MPLRPKPTSITGQNQGPTPAELLAKMPRRPMSPEQQAAALEKVQQQATQRVKLGQQLFEAADAKLKQHQQILKEIQDQQQVLRDKVQEDVAKSLQSYDQWMGRIDESFTQAIKDLNGRVDLLESRFDGSRGEMEAMIGKAAALLEQTQALLSEAFGEAMPCIDDMSPMQEAMPTPQVDGLDALGMDGLANTEQDAEVLEVEIVEPTDHGKSEADLPGDTDRTSDADDVFGEVLRRLRSQADEDEGHAAA